MTFFIKIKWNPTVNLAASWCWTAVVTTDDGCGDCCRKLMSAAEFCCRAMATRSSWTDRNVDELADSHGGGGSDIPSSRLADCAIYTWHKQALAQPGFVNDSNNVDKKVHLVWNSVLLNKFILHNQNKTRNLWHFDLFQVSPLLPITLSKRTMWSTGRRQQWLPESQTVPPGDDDDDDDDET